MAFHKILRTSRQKTSRGPASERGCEALIVPPENSVPTDLLHPHTGPISG